MKDLSSVLGSLGCAIILAPIALICLVGFVIVVIAEPLAGLIFGVICVVIGRAIYDARKGS
jgi:hypothetical protein